MMRIDRLAQPWKTDADYQAYVLRQATKTQAYRNFISGTRVFDLVRLLIRTIAPRSPIGLSVLCVGCRNVHELRVLGAVGFDSVTGIDLSSPCPDILAMDMHALTFTPHTFDVVFASHSLEHAYDVDRVLQEWARVTKPDGYWVIEVPIGYTVTAVDRQDFGTADALVTRCAAARALKILVAEHLRERAVARVLLQMTS